MKLFGFTILFSVLLTSSLNAQQSKPIKTMASLYNGTGAVVILLEGQAAKLIYDELDVEESFLPGRGRHNPDTWNKSLYFTRCSKFKAVTTGLQGWTYRCNVQVPKTDEK